MMSTNEKTAVPAEISAPAILAEGKNFLVKKAENISELRLAQHLRYEVFKKEQKRLFPVREELDCDTFDASCTHLLVLRKSDGRVIGTCRLRTGKSLQSKKELYAGTEYRFAGLEPYLAKTAELSRSCVAREFRNGTAAALLWQGLARCRQQMRFDYLLGCASLEENDFSRAKALFRQLTAEGFVTDTPRAYVRPGCRLLPGRTAPAGGPLLQQLPPLFKGYLKAGAKVCGPPAFDRKFGSIDFPVWFDFNNLPEKYLRHFRIIQ